MWWHNQNNQMHLKKKQMPLALRECGPHSKRKKDINERFQNDVTKRKIIKQEKFWADLATVSYVLIKLRHGEFLNPYYYVNNLEYNIWLMYKQLK